jgi:transcriptional regulator with XRE-family HTH domain
VAESTSTVLTLRSAEKLNETLKASGKTMRALAAETGMSRSRISQLTRYHFPQIGLDSAVQLSAALEVDVRTLFTFPDADRLVRLGLVDA